jgi:ADP-heptose:LPS heptosyltransferase
LLKKISASTFDHVYCFDTSPRIAALFADISCPFHWFSGSETVKHTAKHYLDLVASSCDKPVDHYYNYLPVDQEQTRLLNNELQTLGIMPDNIVVMMHPTFSGYTKLGLRKRKARIRKLWPAINYGELGKRLASSPAIGGRKIRSIIALLPKELSLGKDIVQHSNNTITLLESQADFGRYKALLKRADLLLTPDSGPMHIASALSTHLVAFFSMKEPGDCGPYMKSTDFTILRSDDPIKGIATIDVDTVYKAVMEQLTMDISPGQHA